MYVKQIDQKAALELAARGERGSGDGSGRERFRVGRHDAGYSGTYAICRRTVRCRQQRLLMKRNTGILMARKQRDMADR